MAEEAHQDMVKARRPHFYEVVSSSERLKIPVKFIRHLEGRKSGSVSLVGPSGKTWHVDLIQKNDDLFFHDGWPEFVRDHFIDNDDFLVFRYDSELHFTVQVFDQTACEKEAAFSAECSQDSRKIDHQIGEKRYREEAAASSGEIEGVAKKLRVSCSQVHSEYTNKNPQAKVDMSDREGCQSVDVITTKTCLEANSSKETKHRGSPSKNSAMPYNLKSWDEKSDAAIQDRIGNAGDLSFYAGSVLKLSASEEKLIAQSFISCFPYFVRTMKRSNISGSYTLKIPYQFSTAHLPKCKIEIVLRNLKGECWTVNSVPNTRVHTSHTFCGGWLAFVRGNSIKMGDICIFELVHKYEFRVQILGIGKEGQDYKYGKEVQNHKNGNVVSNGLAIATSRKTFEGFPKRVRGNSSKVHSKRKTKLEISDKKGFGTRQEAQFANDIRKHGSASTNSDSVTVCSLPKASNEKLGSDQFLTRLLNYQAETTSQDRMGTKDQLGSQPRGCVTMTSTPDEEKVARAFTSGFPNFVRIMKKFNVSGSYTLKIPYQFSTANLPNCKTEIVLRNLKGECWTVNSVPDSKGRLLHTFCGGWMAFVRSNDIKMGDICIFELVGKCEIRVHISGVGKEGLDHRNGVVFH